MFQEVFLESIDFELQSKSKSEIIFFNLQDFDVVRKIILEDSEERKTYRVFQLISNEFFDSSLSSCHLRKELTKTVLL